MGALLQDGCSIAAAPTRNPNLRSSSLFLPYRRFSPLSPSSSSSRRSFCHGAVAMAVAKHKKKGKTSHVRDWSYEHLMVAWDEAFERCCSDPSKGSRIRELACNGVMSHGRGCVFVFHEIQTIPRGPGAGFTSKPPRSSRAVPDFVTLQWHASYLPRHFLLDPTKAPLEQDPHIPREEQHSKTCTEIDVDELIADVAASETILEEDDASLSLDSPLQIIDYCERDAVQALATSSESPFLILDDLEDGISNLPHKEEDTIVIGDDEKDSADTQDPVLEAEMRLSTESLVHGVSGGAGKGNADEAKLELQDSETLDVGSKTGERMQNQVELISQEMLFTSMKGMDMTRLLSLTTNVDFETEKFRFGSRTALVNMRTMDAGGEDPYNPEQDELVLLLHLVIDKRPAFGADVVIAYRDDKCIPHETDSWKLRLKYKF